MNSVVVLTYDTQDGAAAELARIRSMQKAGEFHLVDSALVERDAEGKVHHKGHVDESVKVGAVGGGIVGLLLFLLFPVAGIIGGALVGAGLGKMVGSHVDKEFVKEVSEALQPGSSAIFLITDSDPSRIVMAFRGTPAHIYQTNLSEEAEQALREAVKD